MKIVIKRLYFQEDCTIGCLQVQLSGQYKSQYWKGVYFCDTLEPRAIPWHSNPLNGVKAGQFVVGHTAIPEGTYSLEIRASKTYKRPMPHLQAVPFFKNIVLRSGKTLRQTHGDILLGRLNPDRLLLDKSLRCFHLLFALIGEAQAHGETVSVEVRSYREWT